jgi:hypothetical protein
MCDVQLVGRTDKRFCNIKCKNKYHSELRAAKNSYSNDVFKQILKNHRILAEFLGENVDKYQISQLVLQREGFDKNIVSGVNTDSGQIELEVLDFTWKSIDNNLIEVKYNPTESTISPYVFKRFKRFGFEETSRRTSSIAENQKFNELSGVELKNQIAIHR